LLRTDKPYDVHELEACDAGISECDALVAQTGSVLVTNRSAGGRALSVLPPHHVVLARREQLVADLPAAFELLQQKYAAQLSEHDFVHHRPQPHGRHRAHFGLGRARPEEIDDPLFLKCYGCLENKSH
jgi:hypothetical protein